MPPCSITYGAASLRPAAAAASTTTLPSGPAGSTDAHAVFLPTSEAATAVLSSAPPTACTIRLAPVVSGGPLWVEGGTGLYVSIASPKVTRSICLVSESDLDRFIARRS